MNVQLYKILCLGYYSYNINNIYIISRIIINVLLFFLLIFTLYYLINIGNKYVLYRKKIIFKGKHYLLALIICFIVVLVVAIYIFRSYFIYYLVPVFWAIIIAYLLNPIVNKLVQFNISRFWSVVILYLTILFIIFAISITVTPRITKEIKNLVEILPAYSNRVINFLNNLYRNYLISMNNLPPEFIGVEVALSKYIETAQIYIIDFFRQVTEKGIGVFLNIVNIILVPIYSFYFLKDMDYFRVKILKLIPKGARNEIIDIFKDINKLISRFVRGQLLIAAIVGLLSTGALLIFKVNFAFLIGIIAGITNIIPYFGPIIGAVPAVVIALLDKPIKALWVIIAFFTIQQIESAILSPKIVGDSVGLHPVFVILSLLVGGQLFGIVGLIFAVPVVASIKIVLNHITKIFIKI